jgi:hypothetical protein
MRTVHTKKKTAKPLYVRWDNDERAAAINKARGMNIHLAEMVRRAIAAYVPNEQNDWR